MKVLINSSLSYSLVNFRGALLKGLVQEGAQVVATAPDRDPDIERQLAALGVEFRHLPMNRASLSPLADLRTLWRYVRLLRQIRPDVLISYTQKPIIYGGLASRMFRNVRSFVIMSGLGYIYSSAADHRSVLRRFVSALYREGVRKAECIFVFNADDRSCMLGNGIIDETHRVIQVPGSGVDTARFGFTPLPDGPPNVLMIARLMRDKGVYDFIEAARLVKARMPNVRFQLLGRIEEENPTAISRAEVDAWKAEGIIELLPETRDVRPHLAKSSLFVLPSFYREGLPRTILEALASGRPVVTTDLPGCRDAITDGVNGRLIPPQDPVSLANAICDLLSSRTVLKQMSCAAREAAANRFDVQIVNRTLLNTMRIAPVDRSVPEPADLLKSSSVQSG